MRWVVFLGTCLVAMLMPILYTGSHPEAHAVDFEFMKTFQSAALCPQDMSPGEREFYSNFPGVTGYFSLAGRPGESIFLRYTEQPTRMLHAAEGCYKASGIEIEYTDNVRVPVEELSDEALRWSQFRIHEAGKPFLVRQCILSLSIGAAYADVPAWYWKTMFSSDDGGPWLAITWKLPEPENRNSSETAR